ncbi:hypothetical protein BDV32DRAFT_119271 [Aspergillus pseudonomiae]|nr:hypothetical protein BDV32DRAFT_119271 [Aspergillus pseudonomiae]
MPALLDNAGGRPGSMGFASFSLFVSLDDSRRRQSWHHFVVAVCAYPKTRCSILIVRHCLHRFLGSPREFVFGLALCILLCITKGCAITWLGCNIRILFCLYAAQSVQYQAPGNVQDALFDFTDRKPLIAMYQRKRVVIYVIIHVC